MIQNVKISVLEYKMTYPNLNIELQKNDSDMYELGLTELAIKEFNRGMKVKRRYRASKKGDIC